MKKYYVLIGNYGSGKTELALNFAFKAAEQGLRTELLDLDMVNTYFRLTERGKMLWSALAILRAENKKVGILIDGMYYRSINPPMLTDQTADTIYLEGPFDPANAKGIVENSERNYKIFNDK